MQIICVTKYGKQILVKFLYCCVYRFIFLLHLQNWKLLPVEIITNVAISVILCLKLAGIQLIRSLSPF